MKRLLKSLLAMIIVLFFAGLSLADDFNFRKAKWGMSVKAVKATEGKNLKPSIETPNILVYKTRICHKETNTTYNFVTDQLTSGGYMFTNHHMNSDDYIDDYEDLKKLLTKKYGEPKVDKETWKNDFFRDSNHDGLAIGMGTLEYFSYWDLPDTDIAMSLTGDNFDICCGIAYFSKLAMKLEIEEYEKAFTMGW